MLSTLLIALTFTAALQKAPVPIVQKTSGWCSPAIANVVGNVTVNCIGVDPRALRRLNVELSRRNLQLADKVREADEWTKRYKELEALLNPPGDDSSQLRQAQEYLREGDLEKAGATLDELMARQTKQTDLAAATSFSRALVSELEFRLAEAEPLLRKAYRLAVANESPPDEVNYGIEYAYDLLRQNDFSHAEPVLLAILDKARKLAQEKPAEYKPDLATILNNQAVLYLETQRLDDAITATREELNIYDDLAKSDPASYQRELAGAVHNLGLIYDMKRQTMPAALAAWTGIPVETAYLAAKKILDDLVKAHPGEYLYQNDLADTLTDLGSLYRDTNRAKEAEEVYTNALGIRRHLADVNVAYQAGLAMTRYNQGRLYCDTTRATECEHAFQDALDIFRVAAKNNPAAYQPFIAMVLYQMALLHIATKNMPQAHKEIEECVGITRERWEADHVVGDDLAKSLIIDTVTEPESTRKCALAREASNVAQNPLLKKVALSKMSGCPLE